MKFPSMYDAIQAKQLATELEAGAEAKREAIATAGAGVQAILDA